MSAFLALLSAFCNGCSAVLQRLANIDAPPDKGVVKVAWFLIRQPLWLLGGAFLVGTLLFSPVRSISARWPSCSRCS